MTEVSDRYETVADGFAGRVDGAADRWDAPSPCPDWSARDVVAHVVNTHRRLIANAEGTEAAPADRSGDLVVQWRDARAAVADALRDETRAAAVVSGPFGDQALESLVGRLLCADTLIHTWDLARATGQDETLDAGAVAKATEYLEPLDEGIRRPGGFAPKIDPAPGADAQTRLLNFCGRSG
jgi:uncharacterized protein (TIGR03086 family)